MKKEFSIQSLEEDMKDLGLIDASKEKEAKPVQSDEPAKKTENELEEAVKILKKKRGSTVNIERKKRKMYYRKNKAKLRSKSKRYAKSSTGKRAAMKRKRVTKTLGASRIAAIHKRGGRLMVQSVDEANEIMDKMITILELVDTKVEHLVESTDTTMQEYLDFLTESSDELVDSMNDVSEMLENEEFESQEELEEAVYALAESLYDILETHAEIVELDELLNEEDDEKGEGEAEGKGEGGDGSEEGKKE